MRGDAAIGLKECIVSDQGLCYTDCVSQATSVVEVYQADNVELK